MNFGVLIALFMGDCCRWCAEWLKVCVYRHQLGVFIVLVQALMIQITAASYCFYHTDTWTCVSKIHCHCNILTKYWQHWGIIYMFFGPWSLSGISFRTEGVFVNVKISWSGKGPLCSDKKHEIVLHFPVSLRTGGDPAGLLWVPINGVVPISITGCGCNYQHSCHFLLPSIP